HSTRRHVSRRRQVPPGLCHPAYRISDIGYRTSDLGPRTPVIAPAIIPSMQKVLTGTCVLAATVTLLAQRGGQLPGGTNPDGSLRPSRPVTNLFTQDAYTEYAILEPGSESFRIRYIFETSRAG